MSQRCYLKNSLKNKKERKRNLKLFSSKEMFFLLSKRLENDIWFEK